MAYTLSQLLNGPRDHALLPTWSWKRAPPNDHTQAKAKYISYSSLEPSGGTFSGMSKQSRREHRVYREREKHLKQRWTICELFCWSQEKRELFPFSVQDKSLLHLTQFCHRSCSTWSGPFHRPQWDNWLRQQTLAVNERTSHCCYFSIFIARKEVRYLWNVLPQRSKLSEFSKR